jgi:hypothetical protein
MVEHLPVGLDAGDDRAPGVAEADDLDLVANSDDAAELTAQVLDTKTSLFRRRFYLLASLEAPGDLQFHLIDGVLS